MGERVYVDKNPPMAVRRQNDPTRPEGYRDVEVTQAQARLDLLFAGDAVPKDGIITFYHYAPGGVTIVHSIAAPKFVLSEVQVGPNVTIGER